MQSPGGPRTQEPHKPGPHSNRAVQSQQGACGRLERPSPRGDHACNKLAFARGVLSNVQAKHMHMPSLRTLWGCCGMQTRQLHREGEAYAYAFIAYAVGVLQHANKTAA